MRFEAEHRFHGSPPAVANLLTDPEFYVELQLPDLSAPTVLDHRSGDDQSVLRLHYEFVGSLDPIARRLLGANRLAWIQEATVEHPTNSGQLTFEAAADPNRLHGWARFRLASEGGGCVRRLDGELLVEVPVIGRRAEQKIVPGLLRRLDIEARALDDALDRGA